MEELSKHGEVSRAAMMAGMDRKTARKYREAGTLPSSMKTSRTWRTRQNPFSDRWDEVEQWLVAAPDLEAKTVLEQLMEKYPSEYEWGHLRTLQRQIKRWRGKHGPEHTVMFAQQHRPGEAMQTDFTWATELGVTVGGEELVHLLCVSVLPYSNWQWATVCFSESMIALRSGVQRALFQLGRVPQYHQTDNSTAATHRIPESQRATIEGQKRPFNEEYLTVMNHFGMTPRTIAVGESEQNGDVEAGHRALKRRLAQALLVRGGRDFENLQAWQSFVDNVVRKANVERKTRVAEDLGAMRELCVEKLAEFIELDARVSEQSTIRVKGSGYSLPARLIGERVRVRLFEDRVEVHYADTLQLSCERLRGKSQNRIDYRHIIWSLVQKPGAFARYVYRESMFPSMAFRRAYDAIHERIDGVKGDLEYLRILHHAAGTMETEVEAALELLLAENLAISVDAVRALMGSATRSSLPQLERPSVDLQSYDTLLEEVGT